ncbi:hypothetical protein Tco_0493866 [Tanacetum coccineum]
MGRTLSPSLSRTLLRLIHQSPLTVAPPTSLPESTPPTLVPILYRATRMAVRVPPEMSPGLSTSMAEVAAMSDSVFLEDEEEKDDEEDEEIEESLDSDSMSEDAEDEGPTAEDEDHAKGDEGLAAGVTPCQGRNARVGKGMGGFGSIWVELFGSVWVGKLVGVEGLLVEGSEVDGEVCGVYGSCIVVLRGGVVLMDDSFGVVGGVVSGVSVVTLGDSVLGVGVEG